MGWKYVDLGRVVVGLIDLGRVVVEMPGGQAHNHNQVVEEQVVEERVVEEGVVEERVVEGMVGEGEAAVPHRAAAGIVGGNLVSLQVS